MANELKYPKECEDSGNKAVLCIPQEPIIRGQLRENHSHDIVRGDNTAATNIAHGKALMANSWDGEGRAVKEKDASTEVNAFQESLAYKPRSLHEVMNVYVM